MRYKMRTVLAFCGIVATAAVAVSLAFVSGSRAASGNICSSPSSGTPLSAASCVTELVAPHFISAGNDAISVTKFRNGSGAGGATATHTVLSVSFTDNAGAPVSVTVKSIVLSVGNSSVDSSVCTPSSPTLTSPATAATVTCPVGNIAGGGNATMTVRFSTSTTPTVLLTGSAAYGEGPGNPSNPPNDFQVNYDTLTVTAGVGSAGGGCFDLTGSAVATVTGTTAAQATSATVGAGAGSLPCTFADAGVRAKTLSALANGHTQVSFVEFPTFLSGYAVVRMILTPVPTGFNLNNSPIFEDTNYGAPYFKTFITVPNCDKNGNIVGPVGMPPKGTTNLSPVNDSCIFNRFSLGHGNGEIDLHVAGSPFDGSYQG